MKVYAKVVSLDVVNIKEDKGDFAWMIAEFMI